MSIFITNINKIKRNLNKSWLTDSQKRAFDEIVESLTIHKSVNLHGPSGVGKTFLAWIISKELDYLYFPNIDLAIKTGKKSAGVVIDNFPADRSSYRKALFDLSLKSTYKIVFITRSPINDHIRYISLSLTDNDIHKVKDNLAFVGIRAPLQTNPKNLWQLINPILWGAVVEVD